MFAIVLWHTILHGNALVSSSGGTAMLLRAVLYLCIIHVNLFLLVMGYYQLKSNFKLKKFLSFFIQVFFYNLVINCILKLGGFVEYNGWTDFIKQIFFLNFSSYGFLSMYIIVYLLSPFINRSTEGMDRRKFKQLVICMFVINCIFPVVSNGLLNNINAGSIFHYFFLYILGSYLRKYDISKEIFQNLNISQKRIIYISIYFAIALINLGLYYLSTNMVAINNGFITELSKIISDHSVSFGAYNAPLIVIQSVAIFLLFGTFNIKSKFINKVSSLTFGIYLIHESYYMRLNEYNWLHVVGEGLSNDKMLIVRVFIVAVIIFIGCSIIEYIRQWLYKILYKVKWIRNTCDGFVNWINRLIEVGE